MTKHNQGKSYCTKHGLFHGQKYKSCKGKRKRRKGFKWLDNQGKQAEKADSGNADFSFPTQPALSKTSAKIAETLRRKSDNNCDCGACHIPAKDYLEFSDKRWLPADEVLNRLEHIRYGAIQTDETIRFKIDKFIRELRLGLGK